MSKTKNKLAKAMAVMLFMDLLMEDMVAMEEAMVNMEVMVYIMDMERGLLML